MTQAAQGVIREFSARYVHVTAGEPHFDGFMPWLRDDCPHEEYHRFMDAANLLGGGDWGVFAERWRTIMFEEFTRYHEHHTEGGGSRD